MPSTDYIALQMCPFMPSLEQALAERFEVTRWFEVPDQDAWIEAHASRVKAVITGGHIGITNALIGQLPNLGVVAINGVGFDKVDLEYAREHGVRVSSTPDVLTDDVADLAIGLIIALLRGIVPSDRFVRSGAWLSSERPLARKMTGRRFGIVGLGRIGLAIAKRLAAFGEISYTDRRKKPLDYSYHQDAVELARHSDVLILATAADASTRHLIGKSVFEALGPQGYVVNVARGSLINETELIEALDSGCIAGAALDVFADEPHVPAALCSRDNVVVTPHIASATVETRENMSRLVLANLDAYLAGSEMPTALV